MTSCTCAPLQECPVCGITDCCEHEHCENCQAVLDDCFCADWWAEDPGAWS